MDDEKERIGRAFARHYRDYEDAACVQRGMADRLAGVLREAAWGARVRRAMEIGIGTGFLTRHLVEIWPEAEWWFNDLSPAAFDWLPPGPEQTHHLPGDAEAMEYPARLDLLASASAVQWFADLPGFFRKACGVLRPGGLLAVATFTHRNLHEPAALTGPRLRYPTPQELSAMAAEAGLHLLHTEAWEETLLFDGILPLLDHLRRTGVNGGPAGTALRTPAQLRDFGERYAAQHPREDGLLPLTYAPALLLARAPLPPQLTGENS